MATQADSFADQQNKIAELKETISDYVLSADIPALKQTIESLLGEDMSLVVARNVLMHFATALDGDECGIKDDTKLKDIIEFTLQKIPSGIVSYDEADAVLRERLSSILIDEQEYIAAARVLAAVNVENGSRTYTDEEKAQKYVTIAELYLQDDDTINAEIFINRSSRLMHDVKDWSLQLRHKVSYARILDSKLKFLDAAIRYYDLSQSNSQHVVQDDLMQLLSKAVTCAILAAAGPQRSRVLGTLYKDERTKALEHLPVLEKMYMEQLLQRQEIVQFRESLAPHQQARLANGFTVLEQATIEHNMLAVSKLYTAISFEQLGTLLQIEPDKAERVAARMISEERMKATIDQIEGMLVFEAEAEVLQSWDSQINELCQSLNSCTTHILRLVPEIAAEAK